MNSKNDERIICLLLLIFISFPWTWIVDQKHQKWEGGKSGEQCKCPGTAAAAAAATAAAAAATAAAAAAISGGFLACCSPVLFSRPFFT
jgi:fatty acid desaturase